MKILAVIFTVSLAALASVANAANLDDLKRNGWLPAWADSADTVRILERREGLAYYVYTCIKDSLTGAQWTVRIKRTNWRAGIISATATGTPATPAQQKVCFTTPPPAHPAALGEPAYWLIAWKAGAYPSVPDFAAMNVLHVAGVTTTGEQCGANAGNGFYTLPRITRVGASSNVGGTVALTRCAP